MKIKSYNSIPSRLGLDGIILKSKSHGDNKIQLVITERDDGFDVVLKKPSTTDEVSFSGWIGNVTLLDKFHPSDELTIFSDGSKGHLTCQGVKSEFKTGVPLRTPKLVLTVIPHNGVKHGIVNISNNSETYHVKDVDDMVSKLSGSSLVDVVSVTKLYVCSGWFRGGEKPPDKPNGDTIAHTMHHLNYMERDGQLEAVNAIMVWNGSSFTTQ